MLVITRIHMLCFTMHYKDTIQVQERLRFWYHYVTNLLDYKCAKNCQNIY